jgi:hypothetical protein
MTTIRNLINGPFDLVSLNGPLRLPANGEVTGEFAPDYLALLKAARGVEVIEDEQKRAPRPRGRPRKG